MGYSKEHVEATRQRILDEAGRLMRRHGLAGVSINQIMESAALTHGGFYAHFKSKSDLFTAMVAEDFDFTRQLDRLIDNDSLDSQNRAAIAVSHYLDPSKSDKIALACTLASSAQDVTRADKKTRTMFTRGFKKLVSKFSLAITGKVEKSDEALSMVSLATCVGSLIIARALEDKDYAEKLLKASESAVRVLIDNK